jgi:hypothetical protein
MTQSRPGGLARVDYDYSSMRWQDFQRICNELLLHLPHRATERYSCRRFLPAIGEGRDRGCDGYYLGSIESVDGEWNVQAKCVASWRDVDIQEEIDKTLKLRTTTTRQPDGMLLIVACSLSQEKLQDWEKAIQDHGLKAAVWDKGSLDILIQTLGPDVITGPDSVFVPIREWEPFQLLAGVDDYTEPLYGKVEAVRILDEFASADTSTPSWALVMGPEGSGRTHLLSHWARDRVESVLKSEDREHISPWWPVAIRQIPRRGMATAVREELDPSGRQIIIADYPFRLDELQELSRALVADPARQRVKLIVVAESYHIQDVRETFSSWPAPREVDLSYMREEDFLALAEAWRVAPKYRYWLSRSLNRNPGLLRLALSVRKPVNELSRHELMRAALTRRLTALGLDTEGQSAVRAVLAWLALAAPMRAPRSHDGLTPPQSLAPCGVIPMAWRRAWNRLVDARHILRAQLHHWEEVYVGRPRLLCQAALWDVWRDLSSEDRHAMFWEAYAIGQETTLRNAAETCVCLGDTGQGKQMLDHLWADWATEFLAVDAHEQRKRLKFTEAFLPYRPRQVLRLLTQLVDRIAGLPRAIEILPEPLRTTMSRDDLIEAAMEAVGRLAMYSVEPSACLRLLDRLDELRSERRHPEHNDPFYRAIEDIVELRGDRTVQARMQGALPILGAWVRDPDGRRRLAGYFGLSRMLSMGWEDHYFSASNVWTISPRWLQVEPEWLGALRAEVFTLLLDCVLRDDLDPPERARLLVRGYLGEAHDRLLFTPRREGQIPQRWDLVELLCDRFMADIEGRGNSDRDVIKAAQLLDYHGTSLQWRLGDDDLAQRVKAFLVERLSSEDLLADHCYLCGVSVEVATDGTLRRDHLLRPDAAYRIRAMVERWWGECSGDPERLLQRVQRHLLLARDAYYDGPKVLHLVADPLVDLLGERCGAFYNRLLAAIDPADPVQRFFAAYYLSVSWARGRAIPASRSLEMLGDTPEAAHLLLEAFVRAYYAEARPPEDALEACLRCVDLSAPSALASGMPQAAAVLARRADSRPQVASLLRRVAEVCQDQALFGQMCRDLGVFHGEISAEVLGEIKPYLIDRLVRVDSLDSNHLTLLAKLFREDFLGLLSLFEQRLRYAQSLADDRGRYAPLIHDPEHIAAYLPGGEIVWRPEEVRKGPCIVRDWMLISQGFDMYFDGGRFFKWVDELQPACDIASHLGCATAECLREWFEGEDPGGKTDGDGRDIGVKYWGIPILLKWFEFDEPLLRFVMPLIERGREPADRDDRDWRTRVWSELLCSIDTHGPEWIDGQREQRRLETYRHLYPDTPSAAEPLVRYLLDRAERDSETERLPDAELEI